MTGNERRKIRKAYDARMSTWVWTLKPGDRVGIMDSIFPEDCKRAALGTVLSTTGMGKVRVREDDHSGSRLYRLDGERYASQVVDYLEQPGLLAETILRLRIAHQQQIERAAAHKAWVAQVGWDSKAHGHFMLFAQEMAHAHEVTPELRTHAGAILHVLTAMGLGPSPVVETKRDPRMDPRVGDTKTWLVTDPIGAQVPCSVRVVAPPPRLDPAGVFELSIQSEQMPTAQTWVMHQWREPQPDVQWLCGEGNPQ